MIGFLEKEFKEKNYPLVKIDGRFLEKYFQYLRSVRKIGNNTAVRYMTSFKTLLMPAIKDGIIGMIHTRNEIQIKNTSQKIFNG